MMILTPGIYSAEYDEETKEVAITIPAMSPATGLPAGQVTVRLPGVFEAHEEEEADIGA